MGTGPTVKGERLRSVSTVQALTDALRNQILDGALPGGAPLREADLAGAFKVSRHTVRTALQALGHEGLVDVESNRGAFVHKPDRADVVDLYRLRLALESNALEVLTREPARLREVELRLERLGRLAREGAPWTEVRDADLAFHAALVDAVGSPRMSRIHAGLINELRLSFLQLQHELENPTEVAEQHAELLATIKAGDGPKATALLRRHLGASLADITGPEVGDTPPI
jgi:DNA-binding GntR family transcriptional regulator